MKRILLASVAFAMMAIPAANAQSAYRSPDQNHATYQNVRDDHGHSQSRDHDQRYGKSQQHWKKGQRVPKGQWGNHVDYSRHHLKAPPHGYRWVQQGNDYLMIGIASGIIASIVAAH